MNYTLFSFLILAIVLQSVPVGFIGVAENGESGNGNGLYSSEGVYLLCEEMERRGAFEKHFITSDGKFIAVSYPEQIHYVDEEEHFIDVDCSLKAEEETLIAKTGDYMTAFPECLTSDSTFSITSNGKNFRWIVTAQNSEGERFELSGARGEIIAKEVEQKEYRYISDPDSFDLPNLTSTLRYCDIFDGLEGIDSRYTISYQKVEEDIVLNQGANIAALIVRAFTNDEAVVNDNGSVSFLDSEGEPEFTIGAPYLYDRVDSTCHDIIVTVEPNDGYCEIIYQLDEEWLNAEDRVYPIVFDPSITTKEYNSNIVDTYVRQDSTTDYSSEAKLYVGIKNGKTYRTYLKINQLPTIDANCPILSASIVFKLYSTNETGRAVSLYRVTQSWNPSTITYANQPPHSSSTLQSSCPFNANDLYYTLSLTNDFLNLYDEHNAATHYGYMIRHSQEDMSDPDYNTMYGMDYTSHTSYRPLVTVVYGYTAPSELEEGDVYVFQNAGSGALMSVHNGQNSNDVNVYQLSGTPSSATSAQKFKLEIDSTTGGYYLRAMCSSNGSGRVLDIVKTNGFVENGCNVQIYSAVDPIAQHWFIIPLGGYSFKIVPRTNMSLALSVYGSGNGSSSGTTPTSAGNVFVSTFTDIAYQKWMIYDCALGKYISASSSHILSNDTYYFNNQYTGKYIHKNSNSAVNATSGLVSSLSDTIRWQVTYQGDGKYSIKSKTNLSLYLKHNGSSVSLLNCSGYNTIPESCLWKSKISIGGGVALYYETGSGNTLQEYYLKDDGTSLSIVDSRGTTGSMTYLQTTWRAARESFYNGKELASDSTVSDIILNVGDSGVPVINKSPSIAIWSSPEDFVYSHDSGPIGIVSIDSTCVFEGQNIGIATYKAVHKITNLMYFFTVYVDRYTYELVNSFGFSANVSVLIRGLYSRIDSVLSSESMDYKAWHVARLLSEFSYDNTTYYFGVIGIDKWDDVAGSVTSPSNRKGYFTNTLNYTEEEYNSINTALTCQHSNTQTSDFTHMQYSLAARLAYSLDLDGPISNLYGDDEHISYLAGWLGDATLLINGTTSFDNDDYMADLDAENLYQMIYNTTDSISAINNYYQLLSVGNPGVNRATIFKNSLNYSCVESTVLSELNNTLDEVRADYPDTYDFLMSLSNNLSQINHYE